MNSTKKLWKLWNHSSRRLRHRALFTASTERSTTIQAISAKIEALCTR